MTRAIHSRENTRASFLKIFEQPNVHMYSEWQKTHELEILIFWLPTGSILTQAVLSYAQFRSDNEKIKIWWTVSAKMNSVSFLSLTIDGINRILEPICITLFHIR